MVIAIDGPAGAGKSTVAHEVADRLGFTYLDSGAMYRSVALVATRQQDADLESDEAMGEIARSIRIRFEGGRVMLSEDGREPEDVTAFIRAPEVTAAASRVSVHPQVREAMVKSQRALIDSGNYVAEGRDVGTVVSPDARLKVFLTASDDVRARRRAAQIGVPVDEVRAAQRERDERDRAREHGALRPAEDSVEIDTTGLTVEQTAEQIVALARERGLA